MASTNISVTEEQHENGSEIQYMITNEEQQQQQTVLDLPKYNHRLNAQYLVLENYHLDIIHFEFFICRSWWSHTSSVVKMKGSLTVLLLLVIVCGSGIALVSYRGSQTNDSAIINKQSKANRSVHTLRESPHQFLHDRHDFIKLFIEDM